MRHERSKCFRDLRGAGFMLPVEKRDFSFRLNRQQIGRASCRERGVDLGGRRIIKKKNLSKILKKKALYEQELKKQREDNLHFHLAKLQNCLSKQNKLGNQKYSIYM